MDLREYRADDATQILAIARALPQWFTPKGLDYITVDLRFQHGLVATQAGQIRGFLTYYVYEAIGNIGWMGVDPAFHRQGIGRKLLAEFEQKLGNAGVQELQVYTLGDAVEYEPYARTRAFYRSLGFRDHRREKHDDNPECAESLYMRKKIGA